MSVRPHPKTRGKWIIDYYPEGRKGKRKRITFVGTTAEAHAYEAELRKVNTAEFGATVNPKVVDVLDEYLDWFKLHRAPGTHKEVRYSFKWLMPVFGNVQFSRITPSIVMQFQKTRKASNRTINKELCYLRGLINYAVKRGYANPLPFKMDDLPAKRPLPQIPTPEEIEKFIRAIDRDKEQKQALVRFMYECGLRFSEAAAVQWENIDWRTGVVRLTVTKGGRPRYTLMTKNIRDLLKSIKKERGFVFENPRTGQPWKSVKTLFRLTSKRAKIRHIYPHLLRHAAATYALRATGNLRGVQTMLGHRSSSTTEWYTQVDTDQLRDTIERTADYTGHWKSRKTPANKGQRRKYA